mmetsp:Transcript_36023/g.90381  ORF Transcript_36023/g.90381 Transcript_36023/m.90381 type:complete len:303 (+) Transcript_36023:458-1366(+)
MHEGGQVVAKIFGRFPRKLSGQVVHREEHHAIPLDVLVDGALVNVIHEEGVVDGGHALHHLHATLDIARNIGNSDQPQIIVLFQPFSVLYGQNARVAEVPVGAVYKARHVGRDLFSKHGCEVFGVGVEFLSLEGAAILWLDVCVRAGDQAIHTMLRLVTCHQVGELVNCHKLVWKEAEDFKRTGGARTRAREDKQDGLQRLGQALGGDFTPHGKHGSHSVFQSRVHVGVADVEEGRGVPQGQQAVAERVEEVDHARIARKLAKADQALTIAVHYALIVNEADVLAKDLIQQAHVVGLCLDGV